MITFTGYINFFRLFDLLLGGQTDRLYRIHWIILTFRLFDLLVGGQNNRFYWIYWFFFDFSTFRHLGGWSKWSILLNILYFFDFSNFRPLGGVKMIKYNKYIDFFRLFDFWPLAGRLKCLILLNILKFFDFSTFRTLGGRSEWSNLLNILTSCWEVKLIDFTGYIGFIRIFDFPTLEEGGVAETGRGGNSMVRVLGLTLKTPYLST